MFGLLIIIYKCRHKMEERNKQIEQEDEEKKAADLKERKRKVLGIDDRNLIN